MADEENKDTQDKVVGANPKKKKGLLLGGGVIGLVAAAYIVSMVALPGDAHAPPFGGPYIIPLSAGEIQVNLKDNGGKNYLVMTPKVEYFGYDESYVQTRVADPVYQARMMDALISIGRQRTMADFEDAVGEEAFKEEIRDAVSPLLFPVHVGNVSSLYQPHGESGLAAGTSIDRSTMRGGFRAHSISINGLKGEIRLDEGPVMTFTGNEQDLMLEDANGLSVHVDASGLKPDWVGSVPVGTFGRVHRILNTKFLTQ